MISVTNSGCGARCQADITAGAARAWKAPKRRAARASVGSRIALMEKNIMHFGIRSLAVALTASSAAAMLYVGLYQSRAVRHLWCPVFARGCEVVADAAFARPFGVPDGYIAAGLYAAILLLLLGPVQKLQIWTPLLILVVLATLANALGVRDMARLGHYCFYCLLTTVLSPVLLWMVWKLR